MTYQSHSETRRDHQKRQNVRMATTEMSFTVSTFEGNRATKTVSEDTIAENNSSNEKT